MLQANFTISLQAVVLILHLNTVLLMSSEFIHQFVVVAECFPAPCAAVIFVCLLVISDPFHIYIQHLEYESV